MLPLTGRSQRPNAASQQVNVSIDAQRFMKPRGICPNRDEANNGFDIIGVPLLMGTAQLSQKGGKGWVHGHCSARLFVSQTIAAITQHDATLGNHWTEITCGSIKIDRPEGCVNIH